MASSVLAARSTVPAAAPLRLRTAGRNALAGAVSPLLRAVAWTAAHPTKEAAAARGG